MERIALWTSGGAALIIVRTSSTRRYREDQFPQIKELRSNMKK